MYPRHITPRLLTALADTPVVALQGARQTGKSTLVQALAAHDYPSTYVTFDNSSMLAAAQHDPAGFLAGLQGQQVILDEAQRVPDLYLALKAEVDRDRRPGRFLLTGSANALFLPRLSEALVGRIEMLTLWPLAQGEIENQPGNFMDTVFSGQLPALKTLPCDRGDLLRRALWGGYPEALTRPTEARRRDWYESYVTTLLQRDVRDLAQIQGLSELPLLLSLLAARATAGVNLSDLSRAARLPLTTLSRYLSLLQATFVVQTIQPWATNLSSRLVKTPKLLLTDTGLLAHLVGLGEAQLDSSLPALGMLIENFAGTELLKLASWSSARPQVFYFRTHDRQEVDFVLQDRAGQLVGLEIKASNTVSSTDFKGLQNLAEIAGPHFVCGVVLYSGETILPFGNHLYAVPLSALWTPIS